MMAEEQAPYSGVVIGRVRRVVEERDEARKAAWEPWNRVSCLIDYCQEPGERLVWLEKYPWLVEQR